MMKRTKTTTKPPMTGAYFADVKAAADNAFEQLKSDAAEAGIRLRLAREQVEIAQKAYNQALDRLCVSYEARQRKG